MLPTEVVLGFVDPRTFLYVRGVRLGTGLRADGREITSGGAGLPAGVLHACGCDPDEEPGTGGDSPVGMFQRLSQRFSGADGDASGWT